jgi:hypothetical protein
MPFINFVTTRQENIRARGYGRVLKPYTITFLAQGKESQFYLTGDSAIHAIDSFQRFLDEQEWFELPQPPGYDIVRIRTFDVRRIKVSAGWPEGVETWPAVQDLNRGL